MIIPLWILLVPAAIIVVLSIVFALVNLLQIVRFGFLSGTAIVAFCIFLGVASIIALQTWGALVGVDWNQPLIGTQWGTAADILGA